MRAGRRRRARALRGPRARRSAAPRITASATTPTSSVVQWMSPSVRDPRPELPPRAVAVGGGAGQLRQLADHDVDRGAGQEPGDDGLREELGDPPHLATAASSRNSTPVSERDRRHELRRLLAAETGHEHRAAGDRGQRRARAGRDLPRRAEQRVDERAGRRRVEAVLQRHAGDAGVAEVLRHDQRRHRDPGGDVAAQPAAVVARQPLDDRDEAAHGHDLLTPYERRRWRDTGAPVSRHRDAQPRGHRASTRTRRRPRPRSRRRPRRRPRAWRSSRSRRARAPAARPSCPRRPR